jgi:hypothetical protein
MAKKIVKAAIHPAIGIARVGSSETEYLLGPQVPFSAPREANSSHDEAGQLKREAVEFRIYGYDEDNSVVAELTADNADIVWSVHVANAKAAWFKFRHAMDIDSQKDTVVKRRNPHIVDPEERCRMIIDPGRRFIGGRNQGGQAQHRFDTGKFKDLAVYLGELRTTQAGRLIFLGGYGVSRSPNGAPPHVEGEEDAFGNAADWHDDIADGPVDATVRIDGVEIPTEGAWVVSAPPNYAPDLKSWRTLYDLMHDLYVSAGWLRPKEKPSFTEDIYPVLGRLSSLQWVNKAFAAIFGHKAPFDFLDGARIRQLSQVHGGHELDLFRPLRVAVFRIFREQEQHPSDPAAWPWLYGDTFGTGEDNDPYLNLALSGERARYLKAWTDGDFVEDWGALPRPPVDIDSYPLGDQPSALDRAMLDFCAADAFHPGIELTWPMRHLSIYEKPFRIRRAKEPEADYGSQLDVRTALDFSGPLHGQFPGSLSRWMLVPWQVDTGGCLAGYSDQLVYDAPSFWPSRVPNNVLSHESYQRAMNSSLSREERINAFAHRRSWFHTLGSPSTQWGEKLIEHFGTMGVIEAYAGTSVDQDIPRLIYVETNPTEKKRMQDGGGAPVPVTQLAAATDLSPADVRARAAGFASEADRVAMRKMRFGR